MQGIGVGMRGILVGMWTIGMGMRETELKRKIEMKVYKMQFSFFDKIVKKKMKLELS